MLGKYESIPKPRPTESQRYDRSTPPSYQNTPSSRNWNDGPRGRNNDRKPGFRPYQNYREEQDGAKPQFQKATPDSRPNENKFATTRFQNKENVTNRKVNYVERSTNENPNLHDQERNDPSEEYWEHRESSKSTDQEGSQGSSRLLN